MTTVPLPRRELLGLEEVELDTVPSFACSCGSGDSSSASPGSNSPDGSVSPGAPAHDDSPTHVSFLYPKHEAFRSYAQPGIACAAGVPAGAPKPGPSDATCSVAVLAGRRACSSPQTAPTHILQPEHAPQQLTTNVGDSTDLRGARAASPVVSEGEDDRCSTSLGTGLYYAENGGALQEACSGEYIDNPLWDRTAPCFSPYTQPLSDVTNRRIRNAAPTSPTPAGCAVSPSTHLPSVGYNRGQAPQPYAQAATCADDPDGLYADGDESDENRCLSDTCLELLQHTAVLQQHLVVRVKEVAALRLQLQESQASGEEMGLRLLGVQEQCQELERRLEQEGRGRAALLAQNQLLQMQLQEAGEPAPWTPSRAVPAQQATTAAVQSPPRVDGCGGGPDSSVAGDALAEALARENEVLTRRLIASSLEAAQAREREGQARHEVHLLQALNTQTMEAVNTLSLELSLLRPNACGRARGKFNLSFSFKSGGNPDQ